MGNTDPEVPRSYHDSYPRFTRCSSPHATRVLRQVFFLSWEWCRNLGQFLRDYGSEVFDGAAAYGGGDVCAF
jgi:hypothetical protein